MSVWRWCRNVAWAVFWLASLALPARAEPPPSAAEAAAHDVAGKPTAASGKPAALTKSKAATTPAAQPVAKTKTASSKPDKTATTVSHPSSANTTPTKTGTPAKTPPAVAPPKPVPPVNAAVAPSVSSAQVSVPSTDHVHVEIPAGLQAWLNADDRMRPWLSKAVSVVDTCYAELRASDPDANGTATFSVTMHANARPSAGISSLPGPLRPLAVCVTSRLIGIKMPLFTGDEGATYPVRVRFAR